MPEIRIGLVGNVDSGKSSLMSVLTNDVLDDGKGSARSLIMKHPHEKESGRTSDIGEKYLKKNDKEYITFIDLAGHEKYLKTTIHGVTGHYLDYALILVGANMGVSSMTKEHLRLVASLRVPFAFVVTKIDIAPKQIMKDTISDIKYILKKVNGGRKVISGIMKEDKDIDNALNFMDQFYPIFKISNKTGDGLDMLKKFIFRLPSRYNWEQKLDEPFKFIINHRYNVPGVGIVFSGKIISGKITKNDKLLVGPFNGKWINIVGRSLHNNFRTVVDELKAGESGCIAIRGKSDYLKYQTRKGMLVVHKVVEDAKYEFEAKIVLMQHPTTIGVGYTPIINCGTVVQTAKITQIIKLGDDEKDKKTTETGRVLRCGERGTVRFKFMYRPEVIKEGDKFLFRDGRTKGVGQILKVGV